MGNVKNMTNVFSVVLHTFALTQKAAQPTSILVWTLSSQTVGYTIKTPLKQIYSS